MQKLSNKIWKKNDLNPTKEQKTRNINVWIFAWSFLESQQKLVPNTPCVIFLGELIGVQPSLCCSFAHHDQHSPVKVNNSISSNNQTGLHKRGHWNFAKISTKNPADAIWKSSFESLKLPKIWFHPNWGTGCRWRHPKKCGGKTSLISNKLWLPLKKTNPPKCCQQLIFGFFFA